MISIIQYLLYKKINSILCIRYFLQQMFEKHVFPITCEARNNDEIVKKLSYTALIIGKPVQEDEV